MELSSFFAFSFCLVASDLSEDFDLLSEDFGLCSDFFSEDLSFSLAEAFCFFVFSSLLPEELSFFSTFFSNFFSVFAAAFDDVFSLFAAVAFEEAVVASDDELVAPADRVFAFEDGVVVSGDTADSSDISMSMFGFFSIDN